MGRTSAITAEVTAMIVRLSKEGGTYSEIAAQTGVSKSSVARVLANQQKDADGTGGVDQGELLAWYEQREKELLELVEKLTKRLMGAMDTIEALQADTEG